MAEESILIVEDDPDIRELVSKNAGRIGFRVEFATDGKSGLEKILGGTYSLVILDVGLPQLDGFEVCKRVRASGSNVPLIILTSHNDEVDRVVGLELGADDYVAKPFSPRELMARVKAVLRRREGGLVAGANSGSQILNFGDLEIDFERRTVSRGGNKLEFTAVEFDVIAYLAKSAGKPRTREQLVEDVWGYQSAGYDHIVTTCISRIRSKLEHDPDNPVFLQTLRGVGYRFADPAEFRHAKSEDT